MRTTLQHRSARLRAARRPSSAPTVTIGGVVLSLEFDGVSYALVMPDGVRQVICPCGDTWEALTPHVQSVHPEDYYLKHNGRGYSAVHCAACHVPLLALEAR